MRNFILMAAALVVAAPASAMPVAIFLDKVDKLAKQGALGAMTSDASSVKKELTDDAAALRSERLAATQAGKTPPYCPDAQSAPPSVDEIIAGLKQVPAADRSKTEVKDALRVYMAKRFPCMK